MKYVSRKFKKRMAKKFTLKSNDFVAKYKDQCHLSQNCSITHFKIYLKLAFRVWYNKYVLIAARKFELQSKTLHVKKIPFGF